MLTNKITMQDSQDICLNSMLLYNFIIVSKCQFSCFGHTHVFRSNSLTIPLLLLFQQTFIASTRIMFLLQAIYGDLVTVLASLCMQLFFFFGCFRQCTACYARWRLCLALHGILDIIGCTIEGNDSQTEVGGDVT